MVLRVSRGLAAVWVLLLMGCSSRSIHGQQRVSLMARLGPTGVWSAGAAASGKSDTSSRRAEWRSSLEVDQAGWSQSALMTALTVAKGLEVGLGVNAARGGPVQLLLGATDGTCGWQVEVPAIQPVAQPWGLTCWGGCHIDFVGRSGLFQVEWKPGNFPEVWLSLLTSSGECTLGSGGLFWTWVSRNSDRIPWRFSIGVMRANLPWAGLDWGGEAGMGPDMGRWMALQWLRG